MEYTNVIRYEIALRLPHRNDAKIAKFFNLWLVIQLINHLYKIQKRVLLTNTPQLKMSMEHLWNAGQNRFLTDFEKIV